MGKLEELYPTTFNKTKQSEVMMRNSNLPVQSQMQPPMQKHQIQNPFDVAQFGNTGLPDTPINMAGGITETILGNTDVPDEIRKPFWYVFIKDNILTFLDNERKEGQMLNFDIVKIDTLNSIPYHEYGFKEELTWNQLRAVYEVKCNRALGFKGKGGNPMNERILLNSQFVENRSVLEQSSTENKGGFLNRLLGRR